LAFDPATALDHARRAVTLAPDEESTQRKLIEILLALGDPRAALERIAAGLLRAPLDQGLIALQGTAWRLIGDARADALYDYDAFILAQTIDTPPGWARLADFLADLAASLKRLHLLRTHPFDQSLRHGSQTSINLLRSEDPVLRAFSAAVDGPIRRYLAFVGEGSDPLRSRNRFAYRFDGMWSVRLRPGGYHVNHVHPHGWLSSACHIELPDAVSETGREGWLAFGEPGIPTIPPLVPGYYVRPEPGRLVMFPSYMWHGTIPFTGDGHRLSIAFDVASS
jgi:hypothetical protein